MNPSSRRRSWFLLALGAAALCAAALLGRGLWAWRAPTGDPAPTEFVLQAAATQQYHYSQTTRFAGEDAATGGRLDTAVEGLLNLRILDPIARTVAVQFSALQVRLDGKRHPTMEKALAQPFVVTMGRDGSLGQARFTDAAAPGDRALLENTLRALQVVLPANAAERWTTREQDQNGEFSAEYVLLPHALLKRKTAYLAPREGVFTIRVLESHVEVQLDEQLWLTGLRGAEVLRLEGPAKSVLAQVESRFSLEATSAVPAPDLAIWRPDLIDTARLSAADAPSDAESSWDDVALELQREQMIHSGIQLQTLLTRLPDHLNEPAFANEFATFLRVFPAELAKLPGELAGLSEDQAATLFGVFQLAGTPEVQTFLLDIVETRQHGLESRTRALVALSGVERADASTAARLASLYAQLRRNPEDSQVASMAALTLGALARRADDELRTSITSLLDDALRSAASADEERILLRACENGGILRPVAALQPYLRSRSAPVREVAVGLVAASDAAAEDHLLRMLRDETSGEVRAATVASLSRLAPSKAVQAAVRKAWSEGEPSAGVRLEAARLLGATLQEFPENREVLLQALKGEADRTVIAAILDSFTR